MELQNINVKVTYGTMEYKCESKVSYGAMDYKCEGKLWNYEIYL